MAVILGLVIGIGSMLGGFMAMGGHIDVLWQPFEVLIIFGLAAGIFIIANPSAMIKKTGSAIVQAASGKAPKRKDLLELLGCLFALMRDLKAKPRNEVEAHVDNPEESELFKKFPTIVKDKMLLNFICDYVRLILIGNARGFEIEALMDQEIATIRKDKQKPALALGEIADALPAIGIVAAVLGIVKAMGAIDQSPEILGGLIASALVGTFLGILSSYAFFAPMSSKIKTISEKQMKPYLITKQALLAYINGAMPQIALEHGRKTIETSSRPTIDEVESEALGNGPANDDQGRRATDKAA
ncbi:flagellar motor stator protein MotA [Acuticoccus sediminis]|uniref:Flagellar motor stator protein MotA n=1 Tax=Acuticoccus sediminis TaxID=2184697 RepID=A0A8B2NUG3_9HYPH|nr:flagellar motor stator protein MotA [Acuticoccus sediminis]RAI00935.1 flagellar motor stator protein MotA [Acuticoccus sediminis]